MQLSTDGQTTWKRLAALGVCIALLIISFSGTERAFAADDATSTVEVHFNHDYASDEPDYTAGSSTIEWGSSLFDAPATNWNLPLARACAALSAAAGDGDGRTGYADYLVDALATLGFTPESTLLRNYPHNELCADDKEDYAFAIAHQTMESGSETIDLVVIVCRGTETFGEGASANVLGSLTKQPWLGHEAFTGSAEFATMVLDSLAAFENDHAGDFAGSKTIYLLTGHSLGGAAINLVAADLLDARSTVYAYTFGATNSLGESAIGEYPGIWNVFNVYDTFGPNGSGMLGGFKPAYGNEHADYKFGEMVYLEHDLSGFFSAGNEDYCNHVMAGYCYLLSQSTIDLIVDPVFTPCFQAWKLVAALIVVALVTLVFFIVKRTRSRRRKNAA